MDSISLEDIVKANKYFVYNSNPYESLVPKLNFFVDKDYRETVVNGYRKREYNGSPIVFMTDYNPFYFENFFDVWEIIQKYSLITDQCKNFMFEDDNSPLGHIEAIMKYREENYKYENDIYQRLPLIKPNIDEIYKKFISVYSNHKIYDFTGSENPPKQILKYYNSKPKADFLVCYSEKAKKMLYGVLACKKGANIIVYIKDFNMIPFNINKLVKFFSKHEFYKPQFHNQLNPSLYLVLIGFNGCTDDFYEDIDNMTLYDSINNSSVISKQKKRFINSYLEMASINPYEIDQETCYKNCLDWIISNNLPFIDKIEKIEPEYYTYFLGSIEFTDELMDMLHKNKRELNKFKRIIDTKEQFVRTDLRRNIIDWNQLTDYIDFNRNLKKFVTWKFEAETVTNTWLKYYEIFTQEKLFQNSKIGSLKTFHICEKSGASIFALNHYINTKTNIDNYQWYAQTPFNLGNVDTRLMKMYPEKWILGKNSKGELTDPCYENDSRLKDIDFIIGDDSPFTPPNKLNEQESFAFPSIKQQVELILKILPKNKSCLFKMYLPFAQKESLELLNDIHGKFETVKIIKPRTSHLSSSEIFIFCENYKMKAKIKDADIVKISSELTTRQIISIKRSLYLQKNYHQKIELQNQISKERENYISNWLDNMDIKINKNNKILKKRNYIKGKIQK